MSYIYDARLGNVFQYGANATESRRWLRGWLTALVGRKEHCCRNVNRDSKSCLEIFRENLERARLETASHEREGRL